MSGRLDGRVAFVTGAGRNIGKAIALKLASEGASVAIGDIIGESAESVAAQIREAGGSAVAAVGDLSDFATVDRVFGEVEQSLGTVDLLVNNAYARIGETNWASFLTVAPADWSLFVNTNMNMFFGCSQRVARALASEGTPGAIVNISTNGADRPHRNHIAYDSVKGGLDSFTRAIAVDLAPWQIRANGIRPGNIMIEDEPDEVWPGDKRALRAAQIPLGRPGVGDDIAGAVVYLGSHEARYVTGQIINVDGGMLTQGRAPQVEMVEVRTPHNIDPFTRTLLGE